jgi:hypothetical protein
VVVAAVSDKAASDTGSYSYPRKCVCGKTHFNRALYWKHRLAAEKAAKK